MVCRARPSRRCVRSTLCHLPAEGNLPDAHWRAFEHCLRAGAGVGLCSHLPTPGPGRNRHADRPAMVPGRSRLPGVGAERRGLPVALSYGGGVHAPGAGARRSRPWFNRFLPHASNGRSPRPYSNLRPSATAPMAGSPISMGSILVVPGAGAAWRLPCLPSDQRSDRDGPRSETGTRRPAYTMLRITTWANTGLPPVAALALEAQGDASLGSDRYFNAGSLISRRHHRVAASAPTRVQTKCVRQRTYRVARAVRKLHPEFLVSLGNRLSMSIAFVLERPERPFSCRMVRRSSRNSPRSSRCC